MQSSSSLVGYRDDEYYQLGLAMSYQMQPKYDGNWTPVDPALYSFHFDQQQKQLSTDYNQFHIPSTSYQTPTIPMTEAMGYNGHLSGWHAPMDPYKDLRYDSPSGHFGGSISEASSDYTFSPEVTRQQMTLGSTRYISPPIESQFSQQTWASNSSYMLTPNSTPLSVQTPSVAMRELEFPSNPEFQLDSQEDDIRSQLPVNAPEELEISDNIASLTTTAARANTTFSTHSSYETDSSVSTPAIDNDSDSDFDPKRRPSRPNIGVRNPSVRSPRRPSSSYPTLDTNNRVHKHSHSRPVTSKEKSKPKPPAQINTSTNSTTNTKAPKSFPCTFHIFGCPSTFANKNEWKRHVTSQHLQLGFYRCDLGTCNPDNTSQLQFQSAQGPNQGRGGRGHNKRRSISQCSPQASFDDSIEEVRVYNDFNRKDLFTQHCRRMHGPSRHLVDGTTHTNQAINERLRIQERKSSANTGKSLATKEDEAAFEEELDAIRTRCWTLRRHAPERSGCGFCGKTFEASAHMGPNDSEGKAEERAWEERMEHLGKHYERDGCLPRTETTDQHLLQWGLEEGILCEVDGVGVWLVGYELPNTSQRHEANGENETDMGLKREGLRRRGPRRKTDVGAAIALPHRPVHIKEDDGSDADAMAEDD